MAWKGKLTAVSCFGVLRPELDAGLPDISSSASCDCIDGTSAVVGRLAAFVWLACKSGVLYVLPMGVALVACFFNAIASREARRKSEV